jgi:hypothetical protein
MDLQCSSVAQQAERPAVPSKCSWHLCDRPLTGRQKRFCSAQCKNKYYVARRRQELGKCILVCLNCHAEIHAGLHKESAALASNG